MSLPTRLQPLAEPVAAEPPGASGWLALDAQLCFALYASSLAVTKAYKPLLDPLGLTYPQYLVMLTLWQQDGLAVGQLGERLTLDSGTLTPLLKRLEAQGLLQRRRDAADERRVRVQLSPAGQALRQRAEAVPRTLAGLLGCDLNEIHALTGQLHRLRQQIQTQTVAQAANAARHGTPPDPAD